MNAKVIGVTNSKGGVAKSMTAVTVTQLCGLAEYKTLVIDMDSQGNATDIFHAYKDTKKGVVRMMKDEGMTRESILSCIYPTECYNVDIMPSCDELRTIIYYLYDLQKERNIDLILKKALARIQYDYDYIIIDNSPFFSYATELSLCASDYILCPISADSFSYKGVSEVMKSITRLNSKNNLEIQLKGVFFTRVDKRWRIFKDYYNYYRERVSDVVLKTYVRVDKTARISTGDLEPPVTVNSKSNLVADYISVLREIGLIDDAHYSILKENLQKGAYLL